MKRSLFKRLDNGLELIIKPTDYLHSVGISTAVGYGPLFETPDVSGSSNLIGEMLFKGTEKRSYADVRKIIRQNALEGQRQGYPEITAYTLQASNGTLDTALELLSDCLSNVYFDKNTLEKQKDELVQRNTAVLDDHQSFLYKSMWATLFSEHASRLDMFGNAETIKNVSADTLASIKGKGYTMPNTVLVITGNVEPSNAEDTVVKHFAGLPRTRPDIAVPELDVSHKNYKKEIRRRGLSQSWVMMAFKTPGYTPSNKMYMPTTVVTTSLLSRRLYKEVREKRGLVYGIRSNGLIYRNFGTVIIEFSSRPEDRERVNDVIQLELNKLSNGELSGEEIKNAVSKELTRMELLLDNPHKTAENGAVNKSLYGNQKVLAKIRKVGPDEIVQFVNTHMVPENTVTIDLEPEDNV
jgi:predicted Zn-dependent peptidase